MFDLTERPLHWITVEWPGLSQDEADADGLSVPTKHMVELRVELVDREELKDLFPAIFAPDENRASLEEVVIFKRVVKAWRKIVSGGVPVKFSEPNIKKLLSVPMFAGAFTGAYVTAVAGMVETREKNSQTPPSSGRAAEAGQATTTPSLSNAESSA